MANTVAKSIKEMSKITKEEWREYTKTVWHIANTTHDTHPAVFPVEIPRRLIKLFSFYGETVLDPFAGTGVTARAAIELGRNSICVEQNADYASLIQQELAHYAAELGITDQTVEVHNADSRDLGWLSNDSIDLVVTSPPYWNKADYGPGEVNLGNIEGYRDFFEKIRPVFEEIFRVLRPGRKCAVVTANVNQYTDYGLLTFPLSADFTNLLRDVGFVLISEVIWSKDGTGGKWGSWGSQRPIFGSYPYPPNLLFKNVHEYVLIFSKPPAKRINKENALPYEQIMALANGNGRA